MKGKKGEEERKRRSFATEGENERQEGRVKWKGKGMEGRNDRKLMRKGKGER